MTPADLVTELSGRGAQLWPEGSHLRYRAPKGALTPDLRQLLAQRKADVLLLLRQRGGELADIKPLSHGQGALWFLHRTTPNSTAHSMAIAGRIESPLVVPALRRACQALIDRHPTLRTTYEEGSGGPVQRIHGHLDLWWEQKDASLWSPQELSDQMRRAYGRPFDLERGPILRVHLFSRSSQDHVWLLVVHHIAVDAWSILLLLGELGPLYTAEITGIPSTLPMPRVGYADFVHWQRSRLEGPDGENLWKYWSAKLAGDLPVLNLCTDRPRPPVRALEGASHSFRIDSELTSRLKAFALTEGVTLFTVLLAAFGILLHRYTGQESILVGSPVTGRGHEDFDRVVGYFVNLVTCRCEFSGNPTFRQFLARTRDDVGAALSHQDYPFSMLVEKLKPMRDASRTPVVQAIFNFLANARRVSSHLNQQSANGGVEICSTGLNMEFLPFAQQEGQFDITLEIAETESDFISKLKYDTALFEEDTIQRMAVHFQMLLTGIVENPDERVGDLRLLTVAERAQIHAWNRTAAPYPYDQTIHTLFEHRTRSP
jgi:Condensation domain/TubC N-terminal docking domain